jgi:hypothetical protein
LSRNTIRASSVILARPDPLVRVTLVRRRLDAELRRIFRFGI